MITAQRAGAATACNSERKEAGTPSRRFGPERRAARFPRPPLRISAYSRLKSFRLGARRGSSAECARPMLPDVTAPRLEYVREPAVSPELDSELCALISGCFTSPEDAFLKHQRWVHEMPQHRYLLREEGGRLVAHAAVHEKRVGVGEQELLVGGIAEVCVLESQRGRGYVRRLLEAAHAGLLERGIDFALLIGKFDVYRSSGYRRVVAPVRRLNHRTQVIEVSVLDNVLYRQLTEKPWPPGPVDLRGPLF